MDSFGRPPVMEADATQDVLLITATVTLVHTATATVTDFVARTITKNSFLAITETTTRFTTTTTAASPASIVGDAPKSATSGSAIAGLVLSAITLFLVAILVFLVLSLRRQLARMENHGGQLVVPRYSRARRPASVRDLLEADVESAHGDGRLSFASGASPFDDPRGSYARRSVASSIPTLSRPLSTTMIVSDPVFSISVHSPDGMDDQPPPTTGADAVSLNAQMPGSRGTSMGSSLPPPYDGPSLTEEPGPSGEGTLQSASARNTTVKGG